MRAIPLNDEVVDVIICNSTLEHIRDMETVLKEFSRILRPGGYLLFTVPSIHFEKMLFRYRIFCPFRKDTAARLAKDKSERMSHLHYLHPTIWAEHLQNSLFPVVSWRPIVPTAVVAWGDILSTFRDAGWGGGKQSLRVPGRRISDIPLRIKKRFCIEVEQLIARFSGCFEREPLEGAEGAYLIVAQRGSERSVFRASETPLITEVRQIPPQMIPANLSTPYADEYPSHS